MDATSTGPRRAGRGMRLIGGAPIGAPSDFNGAAPAQASR